MNRKYDRMIDDLDLTEAMEALAILKSDKGHFGKWNAINGDKGQEIADLVIAAFIIGRSQAEKEMKSELEMMLNRI